MNTIRRSRLLGLISVVLFACVDQGSDTSPPAPRVSSPTSSTATSQVFSTSLTATSQVSEVTILAPGEIVGLVGCSMTIDAVEGYASLGGTAMWPLIGLDYGQGAVARWGDIHGSLGFWERFDAALENEPATGSFWWQLCTSGARKDNFDHALVILSELEQRLPEASIYVSAQPGYADGHVCPLAGPDGPDLMEELAAALVETEKVLAGPTLSPLQPDQLVDDCHAGREGKAQMGTELLDFFG